MLYNENRFVVLLYRIKVVLICFHFEYSNEFHKIKNPLKMFISLSNIFDCCCCCCHCTCLSTISIYRRKREKICNFAYVTLLYHIDMTACFGMAHDGKIKATTFTCRRHKSFVTNAISLLCFNVFFFFFFFCFWGFIFGMFCLSISK